MMLVILNGDYRISEESHNNDVGELSNTKLCSTEGVNLESNGDKWVKYAMIRYKINIKTRSTEPHADRKSVVWFSTPS